MPFSKYLTAPLSGFISPNITRNNDVLRFTHAKFKIALPKEIFAPTSSKEIKIPSMQKL
jgi:hypothetical protein